MAFTSTYVIGESYDRNYDSGPHFEGKFPRLPPVTKKYRLFDFELDSLLGVPAGPLINSSFIRLYALLGFDIPVYKTVRTIARECKPNPNCVYVDSSRKLTAGDIMGHIVARSDEPLTVEEIAITNSFGMPSKDPEVWQADIEKANGYLRQGQVMPVSVVGTPDEVNPDYRDLALDYARCAALAKEAGAKIIEANYSCPNVKSSEGSIYQSAEFSSLISKEIRAAIGDTPFIIKVGYFSNPMVMKEVLAANAAHVNGVSGINTIPMNVSKSDGSEALPGRTTSGMCGSIISDMALEFVREASAEIRAMKYDMVLCGVGGVVKPEDIFRMQEAGADIVMSATGAMWNTSLAADYKNLIQKNG